MDAALKVMRRNGFQGASVQDILDRAGLSTRAFYRQFQSKDDLLLAMFRTASGADVDTVARRVEEAPTSVEAPAGGGPRTPPRSAAAASRRPCRWR